MILTPVNNQSLTISVIIPNYNHAHFLPECLEAIFRQSRKPLEIIIIDDASTDSSVRFIQEIQKTHPEIILIRNQHNIGPAESLNRALKIAKGDLLAFCAADDLVLPCFFEEAAHALLGNPDVGICCSDPSFFKNIKPYKIEVNKLLSEKKAKIISKDDISEYFLNSTLWISSHASLFRRTLVIEYGGFNVILKSLCDWYLNVKIALNHGVIYLPKPFGAFRLLDTSYSSQLNRNMKTRNLLFDNLFKSLDLETLDYRIKFRDSGVLGLVHNQIVLYLLLRSSLWMYLPSVFRRKAINFIGRLKRCVFGNELVVH